MFSRFHSVANLISAFFFFKCTNIRLRNYLFALVLQLRFIFQMFGCMKIEFLWKFLLISLLVRDSRLEQISLSIIKFLYAVYAIFIIVYLTAKCNFACFFPTLTPSSTNSILVRPPPTT